MGQSFTGNQSISVSAEREKPQLFRAADRAAQHDRGIFRPIH